MRQFQFKLTSDHSVRFKVASSSQRNHKQINIDKTLPSIKLVMVLIATRPIKDLTIYISMQKAAKYSKSTTDNVEQIKNIHVISRKDPFMRCVGCSRRKVVRGCLETVGHFSVVRRNSQRSLP